MGPVLTTRWCHGRLVRPCRAALRLSDMGSKLPLPPGSKLPVPPGAAGMMKNGEIGRTGAAGGPHFISSIRSNAFRASPAVWSSSRITFTGVPAARFSTAQQRCAKSIRYIVAHMQTTGERK